MATSPTSQIERAAELIRQGRLVAFPTETVYGLGANALNAAAVARIFSAKGRPRTSPLIVHVASLDMARTLAAVWPKQAAALAARFWPGPLTLVVPKTPLVPDIVTAGLGTVGLRMPNHAIALELIRTAGLPIAAPSANPFSQLSPTTAEHVRKCLGDVVDLVLDGGPSHVGIESTVLSLVGDPLLLRPGMVSKKEIEEVIGPVEVAGSPGQGAHPSPGMHHRHYSPLTPLRIVEEGWKPEGNGVYLYIGRPVEGCRSIRMPEDPAGYAAILYKTLHGLDREGLDWIAVEKPPEGSRWAGIHDRLRRAARG